ncbi:hypothetical protein ASB65_16810 [Agrobacterium tumefaciens str. B6]|nr:hypothetical protein ASB65_16810 [Agrobacterium tumefaciens str. B6]MQB27615.1 hypothetical protein [Agrobacterium tumefaciens]OCJ39446.1 hypothetical protein A6U90_19150 [Agrobacterium tumefaciens]
MRYIVILKYAGEESSVFEADDITRCFGWIRIQTRKFPEIQKGNYKIVDRDLDNDPPPNMSFWQFRKRAQTGYHIVGKSRSRIQLDLNCGDGDRSDGIRISRGYVPNSASIR